MTDSERTPPTTPRATTEENSDTKHDLVHAIGTLADQWTKCPVCAVWSDRKSLGPHRMCGNCQHCFPLSAHERLTLLTDHGSFLEHENDLTVDDPLRFTDRKSYRARQEEARRTTGLQDAAIYGTCAIDQRQAVLMVLDFAFMGGTMGVVMGEKLLRAASLAISLRIPLIVVSASGGGRIQEGTFALFQGMKTAMAVALMREASVPYISVLTDPVFGGVAVSFSSVGDIVIAESGTRAGFAGRKVIERTVGMRLPADFQTAPFLLKHGHVDMVTQRRSLRPVLAHLVDLATDSGGTTTLDIGEAPPESIPSTTPSSAWETITLARHAQRPRLEHYLHTVFQDTVELHGDRMEGDDAAMLTALGRLDGQRVAILGHRRGADGFDPACNWGMPSPCGYRKATRLLRLAERWAIPVVTLVDTPGAYPGTSAEEGNQSAAIAETLVAASRLDVPMVCVVTGEGGSGGGLALCLGDRLLMQENATLSIISPEGGAALLFGDTARAPDVAESLQLRAQDLHRHGLVDEVITEPPAGAHTDPEAASQTLKSAIKRHLAAVMLPDSAQRLALRRARLAAFGTTSIVASRPTEGH